MNAAPTFTASQIAAALGRRRQAIQRLLQNVPPNAQRLAGGNMASTWFVTSLPSELQSALQSVATHKGYRNAEHLLSDPPTRWQPPIPLSEIAPVCLTKAAALQRALSGTMDRMNNADLSEAELTALGLADYKRELGYAISDRHWRHIFKRTIERDNGENNFGRVELYLDDKLSRKPQLIAASTPSAAIPEIQQALSLFTDALKPTAEEQRYMWCRACEAIETQSEAGIPELKAKRATIDYLLKNAPFLACTGDVESVRKQSKTTGKAGGLKMGAAQSRHNLSRLKPAFSV